MDNLINMKAPFHLLVGFLQTLKSLTNGAPAEIVQTATICLLIILTAKELSKNIHHLVDFYES